MMRSSSAGTSGFRRTAGAGARLRIASKIDARAVAAKRPRARRHLVEHHAERKQIRARVQRLRAHLLRRHVRHRPHCAARVGQQRLGGTGRLVGDAASRSGGRLRQPEIQNLRSARRDEDVGGLDVAMDDALARARRPEHRRAASAMSTNAAHVQRPAREPLLERLALEQLHRDERRIGRRRRRSCRCSGG